MSSLTVSTEHSEMKPEPRGFGLTARVLHWTMAILILAMLFIGVTMVSTVNYYHTLVAIHRPLGAAIFVLVVIRFINRIIHPAPPLPASVQPPEKVIAKLSEFTMYALMFALPLVGWAMLSAARYPITLFGPVGLPYILPENMHVYSILRTTHTILAYLFFLAILGHVGAMLVHTFVFRDGLVRRMIARNPERE